MNTQEINIAIAEVCGWHDCGMIDGFAYGLKQNETSLKNTYEPLPDFCNDLNAMHEAEKFLNIDQEYTYGDELAQIVRRPENKIEGEDPEKPFPFNGWGHFSIAHFKAQVKAEAFLKAIGKYN